MSKNVSKDEALKAVKTITDEISKSSLEKEALEAVKTLILWAGAVSYTHLTLPTTPYV